MVLHSAVSREPSSHPTYNCTLGRCTTARTSASSSCVSCCAFDLGNEAIPLKVSLLVVNAL